MREQIRNYLSRLYTDGIYRRFLEAPPGQRRALIAALPIVITLGIIVISVLPKSTTASEMDALANGSFERGFTSIPGCGVVGAGWGCFTNGGAANYGFYDDQWDLVVADGQHSQLIEINTKGLATADADRYAGIYQTVKVVDSAKYMLSMRGMIRSTNQEGDPWRYRVEVGWTKGPQADWRRVDNWADVGWNTYYERTKPGSFSDFRTGLIPGADVITIYIRVWKKWGIPFQELDVNLDSIALVGPTMSHGTGGPEARSYRSSLPAQESHGGEPMSPEPMAAQPMAPEQPNGDWYPMAGAAASCGGPELAYNGDFEHGFNRTAWGEVGRGWGAFTNGGGANYGFYDEQWEPVVANSGSGMSDDWGKGGMHKANGQLIEINTKGVYPADADRYAGIFQHIKGLTPGATYKLTLRGLLRGEGNEEDPYRFEAQWGYADGPNGDWRNVYHWESMDLGPIYPRTEPQALGSYTARFRATSSHMVLFIRGWNKWAVSEVEMDLNLDDISLRSCESGGGTPPPVHVDVPTGNVACTYSVRSGDSLAAIAAKYDVSLQELVRMNDIENPNLIFVGQKFQVPGCQADGPPAASSMPGYESEPVPYSAQRPEPEPEMRSEQRIPDTSSEAVMRVPESQHSSMGEGSTYKVKRGDSLSMIAAQFGTDAYTLASVNGIENANLIYAGQVLQIP